MPELTIDLCGGFRCRWHTVVGRMPALQLRQLNLHRGGHLVVGVPLCGKLFARDLKLSVVRGEVDEQLLKEGVLAEGNHGAVGVECAEPPSAARRRLSYSPA